MAGKSIPEISNLEKIGISFQSYGAQQITFFCFLCSRYGNVIKNLKRAIKNFLIEICNDAQKITWQKVNILKTHL